MILHLRVFPGVPQVKTAALVFAERAVCRLINTDSSDATIQQILQDSGTNAGPKRLNRKSFTSGQRHCAGLQVRRGVFTSSDTPPLCPTDFPRCCLQGEGQERPAVGDR